MTPMEQAIANVRDASKALNEAGEKSRSAELERDSLRQQLAALESNVASAEQAHTDAAVAQALGDESDLTATAEALAAASKALDEAAPDLRQKIRVSERVVEKFYAMALESQEALKVAQDAVKGAQDVILLEKLNGHIGQTKELVDELEKENATIIALVQILRERGMPYQGTEGGARLDCVVNPDHNLIAQHRNALLAEIAAAARI